VPLDEANPVSQEVAGEVLALNQALERLEQRSERQSRVVECRFFVGLTISETADVLGISPATVKRDWALASAWLRREVESSIERGEAMG
jgi:RNA polymerase sigma factor (sigma-70 family)